MADSRQEAVKARGQLGGCLLTLALPRPNERSASTSAFCPSHVIRARLLAADAHAPSTMSESKVIVDGQRCVVGKALIEVDRLAPGQCRHTGRGQVVVTRTKNPHEFRDLARVG